MPSLTPVVLVRFGPLSQRLRVSHQLPQHCDCLLWFPCLVLPEPARLPYLDQQPAVPMSAPYGSARIQGLAEERRLAVPLPHALARDACLGHPGPPPASRLVCLGPAVLLPGPGRGVRARCAVRRARGRRQHRGVRLVHPHGPRRRRLPARAEPRPTHRTLGPAHARHQSFPPDVCEDSEYRQDAGKAPSCFLRIGFRMVFPGRRGSSFTVSARAERSTR